MLKTKTFKNKVIRHLYILGMNDLIKKNKKGSC